MDSVPLPMTCTPVSSVWRCMAEMIASTPHASTTASMSSRGIPSTRIRKALMQWAECSGLLKRYMFLTIHFGGWSSIPKDCGPVRGRAGGGTSA
eukprot:scaffold32920_cov129-Isochrysis_galbana.AAC.2